MSINYFTENNEERWDGHIYMRNVKDDLDEMELVSPLPCGNALIPAGFRWNGSSSGIFESLLFMRFPKWKHRIASCRHDARCMLAVTKEERLFADKEFKKDVADGGNAWEIFSGYAAVRIGAWFTFNRRLKKARDRRRRLDLGLPFF